MHLLLLAAFNIDNRSSSFYFCCGFLLQYDENYFYFIFVIFFLSSERGSVIIYRFLVFNKRNVLSAVNEIFRKSFETHFCIFLFLMNLKCTHTHHVQWHIYASDVFQWNILYIFHRCSLDMFFFSMWHNRFVQCNVIKMCIASVCNSIDVSTLKLNLKYFVHSFRFSNALFKILLLFFRFFASNSWT